jgi:hypothetical protein
MAEKTIYVEDDVLNNLEQDNFGHKHIADSVVESILHTKPPYIIGIFGGWGSGKSSLLGMIDKNLQREKILTVTIDAWRYSSSDNLRRAFLVHVANQLAPDLLNDLRQKLYTSEQETLPGNSVNRFDSARPLAKSVWNIASKSLLLSGAVFVILFFYYALITYFQYQNIQEIWKNLDWQGLLNTFVKIVFIPLLWPVLSDLGLYIIHRPVTVIHERIDADELFSDYFGKVIKESTSTRFAKKRLVIFVDNLDRLTDDKMVDALESLKTYLNNENCVFVVACDDNVVRSVINKSKDVPRFQDSDSLASQKSFEARAGEHYLDKFFQQTFRLPEYMGINLHDFAMANLQTTLIYDELTAQKVDIRNLVSIILPSDVGSPRKVKRLLNEFIALYEIVKRRENEKDGQLKKGALTDNLEFLGKFSTLRAEYPAFYKALITDSTLLASFTNLIPQNSETIREKMIQLRVENIASLLSYLRKTQTIMVSDIDPYIWLSQDTLALGLLGNHYNQLRTSLADGNSDLVRSLLDSSEDDSYRIRLARVSSRLVVQRLAGIEQQNGVRVLSHLLSLFDSSVQSEIANSVASLIPEWPADVFSADEILNVLKWAYGTSISTQKEKLITQILERLENSELRQPTFSAILQNADVIENNQYTSRVQRWLSDILKPKQQEMLKGSTEESEQDKNLPNREFGEWLISEITIYSENNLVVDNYYSQALIDYSVFRLLGNGSLEGVYLSHEGLGQNINNLYQVLARRINEGVKGSQFWDGIVRIIEETDYVEDLEFCVGHVRNLISLIPVDFAEKIVVGAFLTVERVSKKSGEDKVSDQILADVFRQVLSLTESLRGRKEQEFNADLLEELPDCMSELVLIPALTNDLLDFLDRFAKNHGKWNADLFTLGVLLALPKSELGGELEKSVINKVLDLENFVSDENKEKALSRIDLLVSSNEQDKIDCAFELLERMISFENYRRQLEIISKSWLDKLGSEAINILQSKTKLFDLLIVNKLLSPNDYVDRIIKLLPFGGEKSQLRIVFDEIEKIGQFISPEAGKALFSAVMAHVAVLGNACPKALAVGSVWVESAEDAERLSFDSNIVSLYESSPNLDLPIHLVSWASWTPEEIRNHLIQIYKIELDSSLEANRDRATIKAIEAINTNERKESVLFIWTQLVDDRDAAEIFVNVVKELLSYDEIISVRKDAVGVVRANTDPALSINNLRLLASTIRKDVNDADRIVDLFVNLFGRGADDVQMAAKYVVSCLKAFRLTDEHTYGLAGAMSEAVTGSDEEVDFIEAQAKELKLKWFKHRKNKWFFQK